MVSHVHRHFTLLIALCLLAGACDQRSPPENAPGLQQALAECQAKVEGASGYNAKSISEKDAAEGYTISGFILTTCMAKFGFQCVQGTSKDPCTWVPRE